MSRECEIWAAMEHPNIVPFYGYTESNDKFGYLGALISPVSLHFLYRESP
jgi:hypothetical protein